MTDDTPRPADGAHVEAVARAIFLIPPGEAVSRPNMMAAERALSHLAPDPRLPGPKHAEPRATTAPAPGAVSEELRRLSEAATPGPWIRFGIGDRSDTKTIALMPAGKAGDICTFPVEGNDQDGDFVAALVNAFRAGQLVAANHARRPLGEGAPAPAAEVEAVAYMVDCQSAEDGWRFRYWPANRRWEAEGCAKTFGVPLVPLYTAPPSPAPGSSDAVQALFEITSLRSVNGGGQPPAIMLDFATAEDRDAAVGALYCLAPLSERQKRMSARARLAQSAPEATPAQRVSRPIGDPPKRYTQDDLHADDNASYRARFGDLEPRPMKRDATPAPAPAPQGGDLRAVLAPFAEAAGNLDDEVRDGVHLWEHPAALSLTAGDLRRARAALASSPEPDVLPGLRRAEQNLVAAIHFYDRVKAASLDERIAVGTDHLERLEAAARNLCAEITRREGGER